jgi:outer membrane usher protein
LTIDSNNRSFAAGSELYIDNNGEGEVYPISTDGSVTLYGLIPGTYKIQIKTKEARSCSAELTITDTKNDDNSSVLDLQCK